MNPIKILKSIIMFYQFSIKKLRFPHPVRLRIITSCTLLLLALASVKSLADSPSAARIIDFFPPEVRNDTFVLHSNSKDRGISVSKGLELRTGGFLSVPTKDYSASFGFVTSEQKYKGLIVKTYDKGVYTFPCQIQGYFILAWSGNGAASRACSAGDDGIRIEHTSNKALSYSGEPVQRVASIIGFGDKQNSGKQKLSRLSADDLSINPGQGQVVIRTSIAGKTDVVDHAEQCVRVTTDPKSKPIITGPPNIEPGTFSRLCKDVPKNTTSDIVNIEVLEGNIIAKSKEKPEGETVEKGQKYSFPSRTLEPIDASTEANSCEMLRFLNAAYWSSPETPQSVSNDIAEQLKQHREALGVSGHPPSNLSPLERGIFDELNLVRAKPSTYADLLEKQKQYFRGNYLNLPGETVESNKRGDALDKTISLLRSQQPLPPFSISTGMSRANQDHVKNQGKSGKNFGHTDDDSKGAGARLRRYGSVGCAKYDEDEYENIVYFKPSDRGVIPESQAVVMEMLINYRPRRTGNQGNLFNKDFQVIGVACGSHGKFLQEMCTITYADGYLEKV